MDSQKHYEQAEAAFRAGRAAEGAEHLRQAAFSGHVEAQNQLARVYFAQLRRPSDVADLEAAAQQGDHVALFVLAMCFIEGRLTEKDTEKALSALQHAARRGNLMAAQMLDGHFPAESPSSST